MELTVWENPIAVAYLPTPTFLMAATDPHGQHYKKLQKRGRDAIVDWRAWENRYAPLNWRPFLFFIHKAVACTCSQHRMDRPL